MLVVGHRGAAGLSPENTPEAFRAGKEAGADILEFDVRLTADNVPILSHDPKLHGMTIRKRSLAELRKAGPVVLLESILDEFMGDILLNLEYKPSDGAEVLFKFLRDKFIKRPEEWDNLLISSFHVRALRKLRSLSRDVNLALLHSVNPFAFVTYHRKLRLSAVGWHRLHVNALAIAIAQKAELFSYVYTVNRPQAAALLGRKGIDAIVTDYPNRMAEAL